MTSSNKILSLLFGVILFLPLFPVQLNETQYHVTLAILLGLILIFLMSWKQLGGFKGGSPVLYYYLCLQLLLILSGVMGVDTVKEYQDLISLFRPMVLLSSFYLLYCLTSRNRDFFRTLIKPMKFICMAMFIWAVYESIIQNNIFQSINYLLYKMERKDDIKNVAVTFFFLPYYSAFVSVFMIAFFYTCRYTYKIRGTYKYIFMSFCCIVLTQSKTGVVAALFLIVCCELISSSQLKRIFCVVCVIILFFISFYFYDYLLMYLNLYFPGNFTRTLSQLVDDPGSAYTLSARIEQFLSIYSQTMQHIPFIGYGLGRDLLIESWPATIYVRYGWIGICVFLIFNFFLIFKGICYYLTHTSNACRYQAIIFSFWIISTLISQMSAMMTENTKTSFIYLVYLVMFMQLIYKPHKINKSNLG
ncbi:O96 family O-antigen polymerase [Escherichia coli O96]|nr:O96 family O-antigen polymerase [Escherichia coli O96]